MKENLPSISVVVPFYNSSKSVLYCLESLFRQDYQGSLEIVCVDDGSTDNTWELLESYASGHDGIRVVHKENGGLSDARNYGVKHANGEYISFVDGDDIVAPWYISHLVKALIASGCKQVVGRLRPVNEELALKGRFVWGLKPDCSFILRGEDEHITRTLYGDPFISACAHLAPRSLYLSAPFPKGFVYEDTYSFGNHVVGQGSFAVLDRPTYGYVERVGSITKRSGACLNQAVQFKHAINCLQRTVCPLNGIPRSALIYRCALEYARLLNLLSNVDDDNKSEISEIKQEARRFIISNLRILLKDKLVSNGDKLRFICVVWAPSMYQGALAIYKRMGNGRNS